MNFHDYKTIEQRLNDTDIYTLIADCDTILAENPTEFMRLLRLALSLSAHVLEKDKSALAHQLAGRLYHHVDKNADIKAFVDGIIPPKNSLYPISNGYDLLIPAGRNILTGHEKEVKGAIELRDGRILSWSADETLRIWSNGGLPLAILRGHEDEVGGAIELQDGNILSWAYDYYFTCNDVTLRLWGHDGKPLATFIGHTDDIYGALELDNGKIVSWSYDKTLRLWEKDGTHTIILTGRNYGVKNVIKLHDGRLLSWGDNFSVWNADGTLLSTFDCPKDGVKKEIHNGRLLSWSCDNFSVWDVDGTLLSTIDHPTPINMMGGLIQLRDGRILSWQYDNTFWIWDLDNISARTLLIQNESIASLIELRDGRFLSSGDKIRLWKPDGTFIKTFDRCKHSLSGIKELRDGRILASDVYDNVLQVWDIDGTDLITLVGHEGGINGKMELSDGRILSWSRDNTLRLWDSHRR
ncbi:MAG: hypothetical protein SFZ02_18485 [bacterium]|nr:hypothetical protein [bacterium]